MRAAHYLPLGQGSVPTAEVLREQNLPAYAASEFDFPVSDVFTVRKPAGCPPGSHAAEVIEEFPSGNRYCRPGPGPSTLPGERFEEFKNAGIVVAVLLGAAYVLMLIARGARASKEAR